MNNVDKDTEECNAEELDKDSDKDSDRNSVHSDWSELITVNEEAEYLKLKGEINVNASTSNASLGEAVKTTTAPPRKESSEKYCLSTIQT